MKANVTESETDQVLIEDFLKEMQAHCLRNPHLVGSVPYFEYERGLLKMREELLPEYVKLAATIRATFNR